MTETNTTLVQALGMFPRSTRVLAMAIKEGATQAIDLDRTAQQKEGDGPRSVVTQGDVRTQALIIERLEMYMDERPFRILCEENTDNPLVINPVRPCPMLEGIRVGVDPIDGSTLFGKYFPEWCSGGMVMENGRIVSSVICCPESNGGIFLVTAFDRWMLMERGKIYVEQFPLACLPSPALKDAVILRGVDTELYANLTGLMPRLATRAQAIYTVGSCHFGLLQAALGRAAAFIQTPQKPWDWSAGYHAITSKGGAFRFFRLKDGNLIPVERYDERAFLPGHENRLGFIAGDPATVEQLFEQLPMTGWETYDPDTVTEAA